MLTILAIWNCLAHREWFQLDAGLHVPMIITVRDSCVVLVVLVTITRKQPNLRGSMFDVAAQLVILYIAPAGAEYRDD